MKYLLSLIGLIAIACSEGPSVSNDSVVPKPDFLLTWDQTHDKFSQTLPPVVRVPSGSVIEAHTHEATGGQLDIHSTIDDWNKVDFDKIHTLTGPIYVEGAEAGDVLAVELLELEPGDWGWTATTTQIGFLKGERETSQFKTYQLDKENNRVQFAEGTSVETLLFEEELLAGDASPTLDHPAPGQRRKHGRP